MSDAIVCVRVQDGGIVSVDSVTRACEGCGADVWIAPSGLELVAEHTLTILCSSCAAARMQREGPPEFMPVTDRQLAEAAATMYHYRRRN